MVSPDYQINAGKLYDFTEVNYVTWGFAGAHYIPPINQYFPYPLNNLFLRQATNLYIRFILVPQLYNLLRYGHFDGKDQYWYNIGFFYYYGITLS
jgi:hypothetical protein